MIEIKDVSMTYNSGTKALQHINIDIQDGEFVFIMGRSGSGKSTLFHMLLNEYKPTSGRIKVNFMELNSMPNNFIPRYRRQLGVVFQDFRLLMDRNVYDNVAFAQQVIGVSVREIKETVPEVLRLVGLGQKYKARPDQLSGGEQQRVAIARAIINKPALLLADEPTGNLDSKTAQDIMNLLVEINKTGTTVVVITHSKEIVQKMNKRVILIDKGTIKSDIAAFYESSLDEFIGDTDEDNNLELEEETEEDVIRDEL